MSEERFQTWTEYFGPLHTTYDDHPDGYVRKSTLYGFETFSVDHRAATDTSIIESSGAVFGYITEGETILTDYGANRYRVHLVAGQYFATSAPVRFNFDPEVPTRIMAVHSSLFTPLRTFGGPVEPKGRLRYIDRCSDTLLIAPPRLGDPCLNLLHFPPGIHQTAHTHPSVRCGAIASGAGYCIDGDNNRLDLLPGMMWIIPKDVVHSFHTADSGDNLNVIAYHPDTDWGPEDETHPMLNRTWVDGTKIDNTTEQHANPDVMTFTY